MKIINNKQDVIQELNRISARTTSENNKKINSIVEEILYFRTRLEFTENFISSFLQFISKSFALASPTVTSLMFEDEQPIKPNTVMKERRSFLDILIFISVNLILPREQFLLFY